MATRWEMYHTGGTTRAARGLPTWMQEMVQFAGSAKGTAWQQRAYTLLAMSYQLQSATARDLMRYPEAHRAYQHALKIARFLNHAELIASAMAREGVTLLQEERPTEAITLLTAALDSINHVGLPYLRGYILQALSEAYAKAQAPQQCWQCIGLAERILERGNAASEQSQAKFTTASVMAQKGVDAVLLKDHHRAIALIDRSLATYDPTRIRGRARLIAQKAEAHYQDGLLDACVATAEEALTLAQAVGSTKTVSRVRQLHATLMGSKWRHEPITLRLGAQLNA
jgi:tetratricopeptide (TPR) repeat protein